MVEPFDLIVIGGGINGVSIARDAAMRGLSTILLERKDFGSGASSKTSKLVHGGLRYLEKFHVSLVKESLRERGFLLKNAPHLVRPLQFFLPVYADDPRPLWQINLGLYFYDFLSRKNNGLPRHRTLSSQGFSKLFPEMKTENLRGACSFFDAEMLDSRIVIENVLSAESHGATIRNYTEVIGLIRNLDKIVGVTCKDDFGSVESIYGRCIVNATGAWTEDIADMEPKTSHIRVFPTKGVHLILPKFISEKALLLRAVRDKRVFFILPWEDHTLVGTTDTPYDGDKDHVNVEEEDIDYLLESLNTYFPKRHFTKSSILASFAGLRPLVATHQKEAFSDIGREHVIHVSKGQMVTVLGGKFTTHRQIAEEVVDKVKALINPGPITPCRTKFEALPGAAGPYTPHEIQSILKKSGLKEDVAKHLTSLYGTKSLEILKIIQQDKSQMMTVCKSHPHMLAELTYSIRSEHVKTLEDWLYRRTSLGYTTGVSCGCQEKLKELLQFLLR